MAEHFHDEIEVSAPRSMNRPLQIELSFICPFDFDLKTYGEKTFAGFTFFLSALEANFQIQAGPSLAYARSKGNMDMPTGVGFQPFNVGNAQGKTNLTYVPNEKIEGFDLYGSLTLCSLAYSESGEIVSSTLSYSGFSVLLKALTPGH